MNLPYAIEGFQIICVTADEVRIEVQTESISQKAVCPGCGCVSTKYHGQYQRQR